MQQIQMKNEQISFLETLLKYLMICCVQFDISAEYLIFCPNKILLRSQNMQNICLNCDWARTAITESGRIIEKISYISAIILLIYYPTAYLMSLKVKRLYLHWSGIRA